MSIFFFLLTNVTLQGGVCQTAEQVHPCHCRWEVCQGRGSNPCPQVRPKSWMILLVVAFSCIVSFLTKWRSVLGWILILQVVGQTSSDEDDLGKFYFYLAFENSICKDYVTEKFFRGLQVTIWNILWPKQICQAPVVPIVLGGANYSALAPNYSFIHVDDFNRYIVH